MSVHCLRVISLARLGASSLSVGALPSAVCRLPFHTPSPACRCRLLRRLHPYVVDVAVDPVFARLDGLNQRMCRLMVVASGVPVLGLIAAADVAAAQAVAQMDPS